MSDQKKSFSDIMDVYAFRIVTDSVNDCYRTLGIVHNLYKPRPGRFKDSIAIRRRTATRAYTPRCLVCTACRPIRSAHRKWMPWHRAGLRLTGSTRRGRMMPPVNKTNRWVKGLLEIQQRAGNSLEFIENVKIDLFPDDIYIFTPTGMDLGLAGATAVDFAYAVHAISVIVTSPVASRKRSPHSQLSSNRARPLRSLRPNAKPNLGKAVLYRDRQARSAIRHFLKNQQRSSRSVWAKGC